MSTESWSARIIATALAGGAMVGVATALAAASPEQPTPEETNFLNAVRGNFPGDDTQLVLAGEQACTMLAYTGQPESWVSGQLAAARGASPDQAARLVSSAHDIICQYLPG